MFISPPDKQTIDSCIPYEETIGLPEENFVFFEVNVHYDIPDQAVKYTEKAEIEKI